MKASNTARAYGWVARFFHWTVAVLILAAIAVGLYADNLPEGGESQLQAIFAAYSLHKTVGMAALALVALRILWTLTQPKPRPLHPGRRLETLGAELVHWALWIGMIVMPLSGWLLHSAAPGGFARILWPFGQRLPFVPEDLALSERFAAFHEFGWWLLAGLIALHVIGALKHAIIDRDGTMNRMAGDPGRAPEPPAARPGVLPHVLAAMAALAIWVGVAFIPAGSSDMQEPAAAASVPAPPPLRPCRKRAGRSSKARWRSRSRRPAVRSRASSDNGRPISSTTRKAARVGWRSASTSPLLPWAQSATRPRGRIS